MNFDIVILVGAFALAAFIVGYALVVVKIVFKELDKANEHKQKEIDSEIDRLHR